MSIIRQPHRRNYTVLPNEALRDDRLSFRATGLLAYLLSLPEGGTVDSTSLSRRKREGRNAIRTAYTELVEAGYVVRTKEQKADGKWVTYTDVFDEPQVDSRPGQAGKPTPGKPTSVSGALRDQVPDANNKGGAGFSDVPWSTDDKGYTWIGGDDGEEQAPVDEA
jgi:hypothetical protein